MPYGVRRMEARLKVYALDGHVCGDNELMSGRYRYKRRIIADSQREARRPLRSSPLYPACEIRFAFEKRLFAHEKLKGRVTRLSAFILAQYPGGGDSSLPLVVLAISREIFHRSESIGLAFAFETRPRRVAR